MLLHRLEVAVHLEAAGKTLRPMVLLGCSERKEDKETYRRRGGLCVALGLLSRRAAPLVPPATPNLPVLRVLSEGRGLCKRAQVCTKHHDTCQAEAGTIVDRSNVVFCTQKLGVECCKATIFCVTQLRLL